MTPGRLVIASTAASAAASAASASAARIRKLPPPTPFCIPNVSSMRNSPSMTGTRQRSEEHTSELQSRLHLVCRLLLEKKKKRQLPGRDHSHTASEHAHTTGLPA